MESYFETAEDARMMEFVIRQWQKNMNSNMERIIVKVREYKNKKTQYGQQLGFWLQVTDIIKRHGYKKAKDVLMPGFEINEPPKKLGFYLNKREEFDKDFGEVTWKKEVEDIIKHIRKLKKEYAHGEKIHIYAWNLDVENTEKYHNKISEYDIEELENITERDSAGLDVNVGITDFRAQTFKEVRERGEAIEAEYEKGEGIRQVGRVMKSNYEYRTSMIDFVKNRKNFIRDPIDFYSNLHARLKANQ